MRTRQTMNMFYAAVGFAAVLAVKTGIAESQEKPFPTFSHSTDITNSYFPLASFLSDKFEGKEGGKAIRVVNTRKATKKIFMIGGKKVIPLAVEFREFEEGKLKEVAIDYYAQDDGGTVYYLGEEVSNYRNGKVVGHEGAWEYGKNNAALGVFLPANPKVGDKYQPENVPGVTKEDDEVVSISETVTVPYGAYRNCLKVKETLSDGTIEYKVYAKGVGMIVDDSLKLVSQKKK